VAKNGVCWRGTEGVGFQLRLHAGDGLCADGLQTIHRAVAVVIVGRVDRGARGIAGGDNRITCFENDGATNNAFSWLG
jgi:hypothetical protein